MELNLPSLKIAVDTLLEQSSSLFSQLHPDWQEALLGLQPTVEKLERELTSRNYLPKHELLFKALEYPISHTRVLIIGQDPYPNADDAMGLAFSVPPRTGSLPPTLVNILKELREDIGESQIVSGDLTPWHKQGVMLLNRVLTLDEGASNSHKSLGWQAITEEVVRVLAKEQIISILWGRSAQELASILPADFTIFSPHPSPLSAYRGFFGSKPFSKANELLRTSGKEPIIW